MKRMFFFAALLLSGSPALAELTPEDILQSWRRVNAGAGATISTGTPIVTGATTRFPDVHLETILDEAKSDSFIEWIDMRSHADGSIEITFSPNSYEQTEPFGSNENLTSKTSFDFAEMTILARGEPDDIRYSYTAPVITINQTQTEDENELNLSIAVQNLQGESRSHMNADGQVGESGEFGLESVTAKATLTPAGEAPLYFSYTAESWGIDFDISLPSLTIPETPVLMNPIPEGMIMGISLRAGPSETIVAFKNRRHSGEFSIIQNASTFAAAFAENAFSYAIDLNEVETELANTPPQPQDFAAAFQHAHFGVKFPIYKSDDPLPFALSVALSQVTVSDEVWSRLDQREILSRTPASFALSLSGTVKLFADLTDRQSLQALRRAPLEFRSLSLSALDLEFEGFGLRGDGDVTIDNSRIDPETGLPTPSGVLDFNLDGALSLLDKIGRLGIVEAMVIIGAKGAIGMFTTPRDGADSFNFQLEFLPDGGVAVNGQDVR